eukprot:sb/3465991/
MSDSISVFNAGPAKLPNEVLTQISSELFNFENTGMSVLEISHRCPEFSALVKETGCLLREILEIPDNYKVLWLQGGASGMFSAIPLNLISGKDDVVDYIVSGTWSKGAAKEAEKYANVNYVVPVPAEFTGVPDESRYNLTPSAKYLYYCDNETVNGVEFPSIPKCDVPIVCDMSSNFLSRPVDVSKFGIIYGGVQKNLAPAGLAVMIIREDLVGSGGLHPVPKVWDFKAQIGADSCLNTPNVFSLYVTNRVLRLIKTKGGMKYFGELSAKKSSTIYDIIDGTDGFYTCKIEKDSRSRMNIPFNLSTPEAEADFVKRAKERGLIGLKGHRSVGGMRASLYNAVTMGDTERLAVFMKEFMSSQ